MSQMLQPELPSRRFKSGRVITALMLREMSTTYGRSPGGYLWAVLEPIGSIAMMTLILAVGLRIRVPSLGLNFPMFFATGIMPFMMYQRTQAKSIAFIAVFPRIAVLSGCHLCRCDPGAVFAKCADATDGDLYRDSGIAAGLRHKNDV